MTIKQVETATVAGTITGSGNSMMIIQIKQRSFFERLCRSPRFWLENYKIFREHNPVLRSAHVAMKFTLLLLKSYK